MPHARNIVGPQVRALRERLELSQPMLAARCHIHGWDVSRETLAKIESQIRWVADAELVCLAKSLRVPIEQLLPAGKGTDTQLKKFFVATSHGSK